MTDEQKISNVGILEQKIMKLEDIRHNTAKRTVKIHEALEGETIGKKWSKVNAEKKPRDIMHALKKPNSEPPEYETDTKKMAQIARDHHHHLLSDDINTPEDQRGIIIDKILNLIDDESKLPSPDKGKLAMKITSDKIREALHASENGKAAGINGLTYEFWKLLDRMCTKSSKANPEAPTFHVIQALTKVYNDIEENGVTPNTAFAEGWMCPLYKKKDKREIANYRPITLLNTDYKIFTKALTTELSKVVHKIIHPAQAGFIPKRSISDQVKLTRTMIEYTESQAQNGMIVALDQEKAYDKICHDYLWKTMARYNLPGNLINTVRSLYQNAQTKVMINGTLSENFHVTRGVRQGDPLSCLLFDIAIEPLVNSLRKSEKLQGFNIPGTNEKLIATLFADDTTVFLSEFDKFEDLEVILKNWCIASGARFNVEKTEIMPIGTPEHRQNLIRSRKNHATHEPLGQEIHIAVEGEPMRTLGAWVGNGINEVSVWTKTIEKIRTNLERWSRGNPTIRGKKHITQMIIGGMTQYLTTVQGMPSETETLVTKLIREFMWDGKKPPIGLETLYLPKEEGGLGLLDIISRNEAIDIMWLKKYLQFGKERPMWAYIADILITETAPKNQGRLDDETEGILINTFIQSWRPRTRAHTSINLDKGLLRMMKTGEKNNVNLEAIKVSEKAKSEVPAWYHPKSEEPPARLHQRTTTKCMKTNHNTKKVKHLIKITKRLRDNTQGHRHLDRKNCKCKYCKTDIRGGCTEPNKCCKQALKLLEDINPKWRPDNQDPEDNLELTPRRHEANEIAKTKNGFIIFDPLIPQSKHIKDYIRIFGDGDEQCTIPATRIEPRYNDPEIEVYTDGSYKDDKGRGPRTGAGIWYGNEDPRNRAIRIPGEDQSNQVGEMAAILYLLDEVSPYAPLKINTDSMYVIDSLTEYMEEWERNGFVRIKNAELIKAIIAKLRERGAETKFRWIKGHSGVHGNEMADILAGEGADKPTPDGIDLTIKEKFNLAGAQLSTMTQALAYQAILERKVRPNRHGTKEVLDITRHATKEAFGFTPNDERIWKSTTNKDVRRPIRIFLWKTLHRAYKIGKYWENIPGWEQREKCQVCGEEESMQHILLECEEPCRKMIWNLAEDLWKMKRDQWPELKNIGSILACTMAIFKDAKGKRMAGANRFYRILITESAHLIWRLRNKRFNEASTETWPEEQETRNQWIAAINQRLDLDKAMTSTRFEKKAIPRKLVLQTWRNTLRNEKNLPEDWTNVRGVLVGIEKQRIDKVAQTGHDPP